MHPILLQIGPIPIYSYGFMLATAIVVCSYLLNIDAARKSIARDVVYDLIFWCVLWGIVGARVFYVFLNLDYFLSSPLEILMINKGGLAWQGSLLAGSLAGFYFIRRRKLPLRLFLDLCAPYIALGQSIGRIGCFLNGCCYGKPWTHGIYVPGLNAHLHPTQLYETVGLFVVFVILKYAQGRHWVTGHVFALYLCLGGLERLIVEFFRADHEWTWLGLSLFQYVALGIIGCGLMLFKVFRHDQNVQR